MLEICIFVTSLLNILLQEVIANIISLLSTWKTQMMKKELQNNIANYYVIIFSKYFQFSSAIIMDGIANFPDIYVSNPGSLLQIINICWCRENNQH